MCLYLLIVLHEPCEVKLRKTGNRTTTIIMMAIVITITITLSICKVWLRLLSVAFASQSVANSSIHSPASTERATAINNGLTYTGCSRNHNNHHPTTQNPNLEPKSMVHWIPRKRMTARRFSPRANPQGHQKTSEFPKPSEVP